MTPRRRSDGDATDSNFVVLTTQRNGSTWVMSVLNGLDGVNAQGELFLQRPRSHERRWDSDFAHARYVESRATVGRLRPVSVFRYLDAFYGAPGACGFKLMYSQVKAYPETLAYVIRHRIPVLHLVRRNHLDVLVSFAVKRAIDRAHILSEEDRPTDVRITLPPDTIVRDVRRLQRKHDVARRTLRGCRVRHLEVAYEDLAAEPARFGDVVRFLGLPEMGNVPSSNILKTRLGSQADVIENYDDVQRALRRSRFANLLD